jgi:hypothetical protein
VKDGKSLTCAAAEFGVPKSTLHGHTSGQRKHTGSGAPTVLQKGDELLTCHVLAEMIFGITRVLVQNVVADYFWENRMESPFSGGVI